MGSDTPASTDVVMDRAAIEASIPHRHPFLFVDRVLAVDETSLTSEWDLDPKAFFFEGHYPGDPIVPGVLLNEFVFQSAALFMGELMKSEGIKGMPVLTRIEDARFKRIVRPGETVRAELTLTEKLGPAVFMKAKVTCGGKLSVRLSFTVAIASTEGPA